MGVKGLIFVSMWRQTLEDLIKFLEVKEFEDKAMIEHMKELLDESNSRQS